MLHDEEIQSWIERHGVATSFTFIVYGDLLHEEVDLLIKGLIILLEDNSHKNSVAIFFDKITEEEAVAWKVYRGTSLSFVFAGDVLELEPVIKMIIEDGLEYLRYKSEYIASKRSYSYV